MSFSTELHWGFLCPLLDGLLGCVLFSYVYIAHSQHLCCSSACCTPCTYLADSVLPSLSPTTSFSSIRTTLSLLRSNTHTFPSTFPFKRLLLILFYWRFFVEISFSLTCWRFLFSFCVFLFLFGGQTLQHTWHFCVLSLLSLPLSLSLCLPR